MTASVEAPPNERPAAVQWRSERNRAHMPPPGLTRVWSQCGVSVCPACLWASHGRRRQRAGGCRVGVAAAAGLCEGRPPPCRVGTVPARLALCAVWPDGQAGRGTATAGQHRTCTADSQLARTAGGLEAGRQHAGAAAAAPTARRAAAADGVTCAQRVPVTAILQDHLDVPSRTASLAFSRESI